MTNQDLIRIKLALDQLGVVNTILDLLNLPAKNPGGTEASDAAAYGRFHARVAADYLKHCLAKSDLPVPEDS